MIFVLLYFALFINLQKDNSSIQRIVHSTSTRTSTTIVVCIFALLYNVVVLLATDAVVVIATASKK